MTRAFLEPIILKPENEVLVRTAFSKASLEKVKASKKPKRAVLAKITNQKLNISELV